MRQMGGINIIETRSSCIIQMGTNELDLKNKFASTVQFGEKDISTPQPTYSSVQQQQPKRHDEEEWVRQQQQQQLQM